MFPHIINPYGGYVNEETYICPFFPLYSFQLVPAKVTVAIGLPVAEIGPAPPSAASHIMTSYSGEPDAVDEVNRSYATLATSEEPLYDHVHVEGRDLTDEMAF